jgi:hypothetical protein
MSFASELSVITPVSRPANLASVARSIPDGAEWVLVTDGPLHISSGLRTHTLVEGPKTGQWGDVQRQIGLIEATRRFVYFLDDDNLMLSELPELVIPFLCERSLSGILFGLLIHTPKGLCVWTPPRTVELGCVDTAMFLGRRDAVLGLQYQGEAQGRGWPAVQGRRCADFVFLKAFEDTYGLPLLPAVYGFHNGVSLVKTAEVAGITGRTRIRRLPEELISIIHESLIRLVEHPSRC